MTDQKFELVDRATERKAELPVRTGTIGPAVVDISTINKDLGVFTYDPGFGMTAATESKITYIDGDAGVLLYRGYPVEQLAEQSSHLEAAHLFIKGGFPTKARRHRELCAPRLTAKRPRIAAAAYKHTLGQPFIYPRNDLGYCANMLNMFFAVPCEAYAIDPVAAQAIELLFILHADHEQNASTSTVRLAGSTGANPYAAISAGVSALWGPAHGGANEAVLDMLDGIGSAANIGKFLARVKDKSDSVRLMGFGHRVYKNVDPRAKIIRSMCYRVLEKMGKGNDPLFELALRLEEIALKDDYFVSRKLYPNVDFYSGIIYSALGIPRSMFTVLFAIARTAGWVAHWQEMVSDPHMRISRPRQLYTGPRQRDYQPIGGRLA